MIIALSYLSRIKSQTCPLVPPVCCAGCAASVPGMIAPSDMLVIVPRPADVSGIAARPATLSLSGHAPRRICPAPLSGLRLSPPRPCRACPWPIGACPAD
jgi:hypothetical protein